MKELLSTVGQKKINQTFPRTVLSVSQDEFGDKEDNPNAKSPPLKMNVKEGTLPPDLQGHVFFLGATGSINSPADRDRPNIVFPSQDGTTPLYNGDGTIYRLDLDNVQEGAFLSARLAKAPCYYADVATYKCEQYKDLQFKNLGIARISKLGARNQLNTAFLPLKFKEDNSDRLLVTWDVGRPYEIDPKTLETVTPVGRNSEWEEVSKAGNLFFQPPQVFQIVQSAAHPCFDPYTSEMFTVNLGRSLSNIFSQLIPIFYIFKELIDWIIQAFQKILYGRKKDVFVELPVEEERESFLDKLGKIGKSLILFLQALIGIFTDNFVYLIRWDGSGNLQRWKVLVNGRSISIKQSIHQMGITEHYVVLVDTAFKISMEELLPSLQQIKNSEKVERILRNWFDKPQLRNNQIYLVRRSDLQAGKHFVNAKKVILPGEAAHFLVDYRDPGDRITMHVSHVCAWDAAEWISEFDFDDNGSSNGETDHLRRLYGAIAGPMDISRLGCHVIDAKTGELVKNQQHILMDVDYTWGPALYAYRNNPFPDRLEDIYWSCLGCWQELKTPHIAHLYEDYKYRQVGLELLDEITAQGRNANLLRLHIAPEASIKDGENRLSIPDGYQFPDNYWAISPQFIPRGETGSSTDGYIICVVHQGDGNDPTNGNELWIFDAADLKSGPKCKLWHPEFNVGFTIHTTWLPKVERRTASYNIDVREDYQSLLDQQSKKYKQLIQDLFDNWVYPKREPTSEDDCTTRN